MLVLSRRLSESVVITTPSGERIRVIINRVDGKVVKLAIEAPKDYSVSREEPSS
jgi:carbon storage regulator CsrA